MKQIFKIIAILLLIVVNMLSAKADNPPQHSETYGYQNHKGITLGKENVLAIVYDAIWHHWYIEMENEDAIDYDSFYWKHNTPYLDFIKVYVDNNLITELVNDYKNLSENDFEDKYDVLPINMKDYNIFFTLNKN